MAEQHPADSVRSLVIVGSGISGLSAAVYAARAQLAPLVIEGSEPGGQLTLTSEVENYPGFEDPILGVDLVERMKKQAARFGAQYRSDDVVRVDLSQRPFTITLGRGGPVRAHALIVASGARARLLGLPGESELFGRGLSSCATCDGAFFKDRVVAVVGGGDSAMEEATFLTRYAKKIYVIHRRKELRASRILADRARSKSTIEFVWNTRVTAIHTENSLVSGLTLEDLETHETKELPLDGLFLAIGHIPNTEWLGDQLPTDDAGYLLAEAGTSETSIPGVFVAGDVADRIYQQAVTAAGTGCIAALDAEEYLAEHDLA
ncbi:MAG: thioredoxin-disulfide reductase [Thermaerobacter sp.]|nr:thioredoxin-disulfide reductase [Thermaerobacter sp.]